MKTKFIFLIVLASLFSITNTASGQPSSNFSHPGIEYKETPHKLRIKKHDSVFRTNRFNVHKKYTGIGNKHRYIPKKKKFKKRTMSLNKKHKNKDRGDKAPKTW